MLNSARVGVWDREEAEHVFVPFPLISGEVSVYL